MSIKPLDLQTLFIKMAQVGKEQASIQKASEHQQEREAKHLVKEENNRDHSVNRAEEDKEITKVGDENSKGSSSGSSHGEKKSEDKDEKGSKPNYFTDPERGHNIDISG